MREQFAAHVADSPRKVERLAQLSRPAIGSPQYVCVIASIGRFDEQHADQIVIARFLDALREVLARRQHAAALIVGVAETAERASDFDGDCACSA